jgi:UDP-N-acetylmuramoylalanine--D-glutamate ligase
VVTDTGPASISDGLPPEAQFLGAISEPPRDVEAIVTSPGLRPDNRLLTAAIARGIPIFGELEFAWRIRGSRPADWLMVTGTNGKTTTVRMLESILIAAGKRALAVGNVGVPIIDAVMATQQYEVLAVEASSFQLHHSSTIRPVAGALLNLAPDHLDWHGSMSAYAAEKIKAWCGTTAIANADDPTVLELFAGSTAANKVTFTLERPEPAQFGIADGTLVDRASVRDGAGEPLCQAAEIRPPGLHNVANALAASALARSYGVSASHVATGLRDFIPDPHRNQFLATVSGVDYVDDSKATNPHAAAASLAAYERVVWIAGGQLKGAPVEDLIIRFGARLSGAVLLGVDRDLIAAALARHAPDLPVITIGRNDDGAMHDVVTAAASLAGPGDVVLLAPAAASLDMFADYEARGAAFARSVADLEQLVDRP